MRILLVHNFYGSSAPSGENRVVEEERDLLRQAGHEVIEHFAYSDTVRNGGSKVLVQTALRVPWNGQARRVLRRRITDVNPDIVHVHNVFPLLSPAVFRAARGKKAAMVATMHNYRTVCPAAVPLRRGRTCTACIDSRSIWPSLRYGCYRRSRVATAPLAVSVALHRLLNTYARDIDGIIALSRFQKDLLQEGGLPVERIRVKPNCYPGTPHVVPWPQRADKIVFIGRLSVEKGPLILIESWNQWGAEAPRLEVIGDGPDRAFLESRLTPMAARRVIFLGCRPAQETQELLSSARMIVIPSICFEAFPLVLREALAFGVPVAASRIGVFPEVVRGGGVGRLLEPGDAVSLRRTVEGMWSDSAGLEATSRKCLTLFHHRYDHRANLAGLESIYRQAIEHKARRPERRSDHETSPILHSASSV